MIEKGIDLLLSMVRRAETSAMMMSRMHCHARNLSSIVLRSHAGRLQRAFLAWTGHRLHTNRLDDDMEVGIHDHRYDLWLSLIHGDVENVCYERCNESSVPLMEWRFRTGVASGHPTKELVETKGGGLAMGARQPLIKGSWIGLDADTLHDVEVRGVAAWLVQEGETVKDTTSLFTKGEFSTDGLYQPFRSRHDVIDHVLNWATEARR
jgi:hypothetical protein